MNNAIYENTVTELIGGVFLDAEGKPLGESIMYHLSDLSIEQVNSLYVEYVIERCFFIECLIREGGSAVKNIQVRERLEKALISGFKNMIPEIFGQMLPNFWQRLAEYKEILGKRSDINSLEIIYNKIIMHAGLYNGTEDLSYKNRISYIHLQNIGFCGYINSVLEDFNKQINEPIEVSAEPVISTDNENNNNQTEIKFCPFCGARLKTGANFCPKCGHSVANRDKVIPQKQTHTNFSDSPPPLFNKNQKIGMLIGVGLFCAVLGIFAYSNHADNSEKHYSPAVTAVNSRDTYQNSKPVDTKKLDTVETSKAQEQTESSSENTGNRYSSGRASSYRSDMESYNNSIVNFSNELNEYLKQSSDFRGTSYDMEGRNILYKIQNERNSLAQENDIDNGEKGKLLHLYDLEIARIQGMVEGISSSKNGGSFANGFRNGTQASYEFDNAVARYRNEYGQ